MNSMCRLCLCKSQDCVSLFENNGNNIVESLTSIKIQQDDNLPLGACTNCWQNIKLAYRIQQDILECDKKLRLIACDGTIENEQLINLKTENAVHEPSTDVPDDEDIVENIIIKKEEDFTDANDKDSDFLDIISFTPFAAKCSVCGDELGQGEMSEHVKKHFFQAQDCETCNKQFENINSLQSHKVKEHDLDAQQTFECDVCGCCFKFESFYKIHLKKVHVSDNDKKVKTGKSLKNAKQKAETAFKCDSCGATYNSRVGLEKHALAKHGLSLEPEERVPKVRECPVCQLKLPSRKYWDHMRCHSESVVCHICGMVLKHVSLRNHLKSIHSTNIMYKCPHCDKSLKNKGYLEAHVKKYHTDEIPYVCDVCGKGFYRKGTLNQHHRTTHLKIRPHVCQYCDKAFFTKFLLRNHLRQHTNDTPYRCEHCGEAFKHNVSLKTHKKSKHNIEEEKKFSCKVCGKSFASVMAVSCHMKKHNQPTS